MRYPTIEEVETASHPQICNWWRFLKSPGWDAAGKDDYEKVIESEIKIMNRIGERLKEFGGFIPEISKLIGWQ